jgi:hypothetical protein
VAGGLEHLRYPYRCTFLCAVSGPAAAAVTERLVAERMAESNVVRSGVRTDASSPESAQFGLAISARIRYRACSPVACEWPDG